MARLILELGGNNHLHLWRKKANHLLLIYNLNQVLNPYARVGGHHGYVMGPWESVLMILERWHLLDPHLRKGHRVPGRCLMTVQMMTSIMHIRFPLRHPSERYLPEAASQ